MDEAAWSGVKLVTLAVLAPLFSCELGLHGSTASLLGTGVTLEGRLAFSIELDLVLSFSGLAGRSCLAEAETLVDGDEAGPLAEVAADALLKKPRMLCCLPVEAVPDFLVLGAGLAGVRADVFDFSPMVSPA